MSRANQSIVRPTVTSATRASIADEEKRKKKVAVENIETVKARTSQRRETDSRESARNGRSSAIEKENISKSSDKDNKKVMPALCCSHDKGNTVLKVPESWAGLPQDNLDFFSNKIKSKPYPGYTVEDMLKWKGDYSMLERNHSYIQWLFPIPEGRGLNLYAQPLLDHEAQAIQKHDRLRTRVLKAYEMMLDFYGMQLVDNVHGTVKRSHKGWEERYTHLNKSRHNLLRITRILKSIGELGYERFQAPWVNFLIEEAVMENTLPNLNGQCLYYWISAVKDDGEKERLYRKVQGLPISEQRIPEDLNSESEGEDEENHTLQQQQPLQEQQQQTKKKVKQQQQQPQDQQQQPQDQQQKQDQQQQPQDQQLRKQYKQQQPQDQQQQTEKRVKQMQQQPDEHLQQQQPQELQLRKQDQQQQTEKKVKQQQQQQPQHQQQQKQERQPQQQPQNKKQQQQLQNTTECLEYNTKEMSHLTLQNTNSRDISPHVGTCETTINKEMHKYTDPKQSTACDLPSDNLRFYQNNLLSRPSPGYTIETMLKHKGDVNFFMSYPCFIQWLFPIPERSFANVEAQPLHKHESKAIREDSELSARVLEAYRLILDYFGMYLCNDVSGEVKRDSKTYQSKYKNLNRDKHSYMRITRVLKSLGVLGFERFQVPLIDFLVTEGIDNNMFPSLDGENIMYWISTVTDEGERQAMFRKYQRLASERTVMESMEVDDDDDDDSCCSCSCCPNSLALSRY